MRILAIIEQPLSGFSYRVDAALNQLEQGEPLGK